MFLSWHPARQPAGKPARRPAGKPTTRPAGKLGEPAAGRRKGEAMRLRRRVPRPASGRNSAGFREWQRIRPEFDSPLWRTTEKRPPAQMEETGSAGSAATAGEGRAAGERSRRTGKRRRK
jgi:hypothetical protein